MSPDSLFLPHLRQIHRHLGDDVSLGCAAERAARSRFQFHRVFRRVAGETLKQYTLRLRLERAAARLAATDEAVLAIALGSGFASHEVFARAFRRRFAASPTQYRAWALTRASKAQRRRHLELTEAVGPCVRFFHFALKRRTTLPLLSITRKDLPEQPILFIRRRVARSELQGALAECFGKLFRHGAQAGLAMAGWPLCRYLSMGPGLLTIEPAMPLAAAAAGEGEMQPGTLPAGPVAFAVHAGPYEELADSHAAIERWIDAHGCKASGAPWEQYVTDPGEHPNPTDWRTELYWPLAK